MGRSGLLLNARCSHCVWSFDIRVFESADEFEHIRAYGMREEYDLAPTARVVDCKHIDLIDLSAHD